ncbi:CLUMA_CG016320, isoform A [Clunio marinus]|uniref:Proteasome subunit beta n=1 Tax=Clunio marinus TaxID=568069 RepID=A0A1J1IXJ9_9DIPT|nr:CLUMA_CG016320, isoform A [Clunio marinus]
MANHGVNIGPFWKDGPSAGSFYNFPGNSTNQSANDYGKQASTGPITTGTSIVAVKYDRGVIIAGDMLVSYGSLARYHNVDRVFQINENIILGITGDYADFQFIKQVIDETILADFSMDDKIAMKPKDLYTWLTRVLYNRRSRFNPLWLDMVVGGMQYDEPFLGHINFRGRAYTSDVISTGFGTHLALPILRERSEKGTMSEADAQEVVKKSMEVLFYRDCRGYPRYSQANINDQGCTVTKHDVQQNWDVAYLIKGY